MKTKFAFSTWTTKCGDSYLTVPVDDAVGILPHALVAVDRAQATQFRAVSRFFPRWSMLSLSSVLNDWIDQVSPGREAAIVADGLEEIVEKRSGSPPADIRCILAREIRDVADDRWVYRRLPYGKANMWASQWSLRKYRRKAER
jgi:hypothetical protein